MILTFTRLDSTTVVSYSGPRDFRKIPTQFATRCFAGNYVDRCRLSSHPHQEGSGERPLHTFTRVDCEDNHKAPGSLTEALPQVISKPFATPLILRCVISMCFRSISIPMNFRLSVRAAAATLPPPT